MTDKTILTGQIARYLLDNPDVIDRSTDTPYLETAKKFNVHSEVIREIWRRLRKKGLVEKDNSKIITNITNKDIDNSFYKEFGDSAEMSMYLNHQVKSLEDLIEKCSINTSKWQVASWECKTTTVTLKDEKGVPKTEQKYWVGAKLKRKELDKDLVLQKQEIIEVLKNYSPKIKTLEYKKFDKNVLLELSMPDIHFGKLSWKEESGEDYDLKIATSRFKDAINDLLSKTPLQNVERILFPIGNDMINVDSRRNMTTAGTPQDSDSRFRKLLNVVKDLLIETITDLSQIAPVDVVVVSGNHDYDTMFTIGMILEAYFNNNSNVNIDNTPKQRKYYRYHNSGIMLTHGNEERHSDLGLIFATEQPALWALCLYREAQLGHFHKTKKTNYVSVDDFQGFQVNILPSLSGSDFWHASKGYMGLKQAKAFLYEREQGKIAEFNYTVKL